MTYQRYCELLKRKGYRIKGNLTFLDTPYGVWIERIVESPPGSFGLVSELGPREQNTEFELTDYGKRMVANYIRELTAKRKEILDAGKDTADETTLPTVEEIEQDINFVGIDSDGEYVNGWGVTDNYDADTPLLLKIGRDFRTRRGD